MKIFREIFKGQNSMVLENKALRVVILPEIGGKIASIYHKDKDFELLFQNKADNYKVPKLYDSFECFDAAGFDDAFPTIDKCKVNYSDKEVYYPDHGEIWSSKFQETIKNNKVILTCKSKILPYKYIKIIDLMEESVKIHYNIENLGSEKFPYIWAAHYLVNCHKDMQIIMPRNVDRVVNVQNSPKLGEVESVHSYPMTEDLDGNSYDLSRVLDESSNHTEKYYTEESVKEGSCGIYYAHKNLTYRLKYDENIFPYIGFWVTEGGFRGDYNCALEPCNGYYDSISIAKKNNKLKYLLPNESLEFYMEIELK
ncbi:MAG: DUF5107 domain-containing protein [Clostridium sp.]